MSTPNQPVPAGRDSLVALIEWDSSWSRIPRHKRREREEAITGNVSRLKRLLRRVENPLSALSLLPERNSPDSVAAILDTLHETSANTAELFGRALELRQKQLGESRKLETPSHQRLVIGMGNASPLDVGLTLHPLYGVPIIPGSAQKGLAAHYCDAVLGPDQPEWKRDGHHYAALFGKHDDAGYVQFHDAWIDPESLTRDDEGLLRDVMTPHHQSYISGKRYSLKDEAKSDPARAKLDGQRIPPTDFDSPVPIPFLSVRGTFHFWLTCDDISSNGRKLLAFAEDLLTAALSEWGIGGKTSSGYGRLVPVGNKDANQ